MPRDSRLNRRHSTAAPDRSLAVRNRALTFRCGLSEETLRELTDDRQDWDCKDVRFHLLDLSFDEVQAPELKAKLEAIPTA